MMAKIRTADGEVKHLDRIEGVGGYTCVMVDDMVDTGRTLASAAKTLKRSGAKRILFAATHGLFSDPALEILPKSDIDKFIVTDTVPQERAQAALGDRLRVEKISQLIGAAIFEISTKGSISSIFRNGSPYRR